MFSAPAAPAGESKLENIAAKIVSSKTQVTISSLKTIETIGIDKYLSEAKKDDMAVVFTFTPGPFKTSEELPEDWMKTIEAMGCTAQLTEFEKEFAELAKQKTKVVAINNHTADYQCGKDGGLLAAKKLNHVSMLSADDKLAEEWGLPTITVNNKKYLARFSLVVKPDGKTKIFELSSPVNGEKMKEHIKAIADFISPKVENNKERERAPSPVQ